MRRFIVSFWPALSLAAWALLTVGYGLWFGAQQ